jgi:hypothetical protein
MKCTVTNKPKVFEPITITIVSELEAMFLWHLLNVPSDWLVLFSNGRITKQEVSAHDLPMWQSFNVLFDARKCK